MVKRSSFDAAGTATNSLSQKRSFQEFLSKPVENVFKSRPLIFCGAVDFEALCRLRSEGFKSLFLEGIKRAYVVRGETHPLFRGFVVCEPASGPFFSISDGD